MPFEEVQAPLCGPASILLMALLPDQREPSAAGPRQARQVPTMRFEDNAGSRIQGVSIRVRSYAV
jgi:hypothetical protein